MVVLGLSFNYSGLDLDGKMSHSAISADRTNIRCPLRKKTTAVFSQRKEMFDKVKLTQSTTITKRYGSKFIQHQVMCKQHIL